jgi:predicted amidophosphoribosyltransferase
MMELLRSKLKCGHTYFTHYYLFPYLPLAAGPDALSLSLLKFKQRIQPDLNAWIDRSARVLGQLHFSPDTIIIRPLRHDETTARPDFPSALDLLGQTLAMHLGCRYLPTLLTKSRKTLPNKHLTRRERWSQLRDVYRLTASPASDTAAHSPVLTPASDTATQSPILTPPSAADAATAADPTKNPAPPLTPSTPFLLIDDILTTGTTMRALISAIRLAYPDCPIKAFTLTRADYSRPASSLTAGTEISLPEPFKW